MRKIIIWGFLILSSIIVFRAQIKLESDGCAYRVIDYVEWQQLGITADPRATDYLDDFRSAIDNPGSLIMVKQSERLKLKMVFRKTVKTKNSFIVYDDQSKMVNYTESVITEEKPSCIILLFILSIVLMIRANILFKKANEGRFGAAILSMIVFILAVFPLRPTIFAGIFGGAVFMSAFSIIVLSELPDNHQCYWRASKIFYFLIVAFSVLLFF